MRKQTTLKTLETTVMVFAAIALAGQLRATVYEWEGDGGDNLWRNATNWRDAAGYPAVLADTASFNSGSNEYHTVRLDADITNETLVIRNDKVVLDLGGNTYSITNGVRIANSDNEVGALHIRNGTLRNLPQAAQLIVYGSNGADSKEELILSGEGAALEMPSNLVSYFGRGSRSVFDFVVKDKAYATFSDTLYIGLGNGGVSRMVVTNASVKTSTAGTGVSGAESDGGITVTGAGASFTNSKTYNGHTGKGFIRVENGGRWQNGNIYFGWNGGQGRLTVAGEGSRVLGARLFMGARKTDIGAVELFPSTAAGEVEVLDGGELVCQVNTASHWFFVSTNSSIRVRDGVIGIDKGQSINYSRHPLFFTPGSRYTVEFTSESAARTQTDPFIWSGATHESARTNIITQARLEVVLTESYEHKPGSLFNILRYEGELEGEFEGLPDQSEFFVDGSRFSINYDHGGSARTDSSIVIEALPPCGSTIILR